MAKSMKGVSCIKQKAREPILTLPRFLCLVGDRVGFRLFCPLKKGLTDFG